MFMRVFNYHDRGVDHGADGDGDAAEAHLVRLLRGREPRAIDAVVECRIDARVPGTICGLNSGG